MSDQEHEPVIMQHPNGKWYVSCMCGYHDSGGFVSEDVAMDGWHDHADAATRRARGL